PQVDFCVGIRTSSALARSAPEHGVQGRLGLGALETHAPQRVGADHITRSKYAFGSCRRFHDAKVLVDEKQADLSVAGYCFAQIERRRVIRTRPVVAEGAAETGADACEEFRPREIAIRIPV